MQNAKFKMQKLRLTTFCVLYFAFCILACERREPLTAEKAKQIIGRYQFVVEPVYAEVPQRVWWSPTAPKDDYDEKALRTLHNLERAGYLTVEEKHDGDIAAVIGRVTPKGTKPVTAKPPPFSIPGIGDDGGFPGLN